MSDLRRVFAAMDGARIAGGCDHCHAYQEPSIDGLGILHITTHHDDWCPWWTAYRKGNR